MRETDLVQQEGQVAPVLRGADVLPVVSLWRRIYRICASFLTGAINQSACAVWVHRSEQGFPGGVFVMGVIEGVTLPYGMDQALIQRSKACAFAFVLGYGLGPAVVVALRSS